MRETKEKIVKRQTRKPITVFTLLSGFFSVALCYTRRCRCRRCYCCCVFVIDATAAATVSLYKYIQFSFACFACLGFLHITVYCVESIISTTFTIVAYGIMLKFLFNDIYVNAGTTTRNHLKMGFLSRKSTATQRYIHSLHLFLYIHRCIELCGVLQLLSVSA